MKKIYPLFFLLIAVTVFVAVKFQPEPEPEPLPPPTTPEEKAYVHEAHRLGTRLYAVAMRAEQTTPDKAEQQKTLQPVYAQIEEFIFRRLNAHSHRISSISVLYHHPDIQCTIYVKPCPEDELASLKKTADACVGRIIENLPIVRYLMVKHE